MSKRSKFIGTADDYIRRQERICELPGYRPSENWGHPEIERSFESLVSVLAEPVQYKGIDLEFPDVARPTIVSVTTPTRISSVPWSAAVAEKLRRAFAEKRTKWVAHSGLDADRPVVETACGIQTSLDQWECSMTSHYLANQHLTKAPSKDESDDAGALGFMDLGTMASLTTDLPNWKRCRGDACDGPCPAHDPLAYCGLDSWAGLIGFLEHLKTFDKFGLSHQFYRETMELGELCVNMKNAGIQIDVEYARKLNASMEVAKEALFEHSGKNYKNFNPRSPKQVIEWFSSQGIQLKSTDKKVVYQALEKAARYLGMTFKELEDADEPLPYPVEQLYKLYEFKSAGKGLDSWFAAKYLDAHGICHPRFIWVGASSGRLSSAGPNFQNIPARGFGDLVRRAVIARERGLVLLKSDFKQLELRMCLYLAGIDPNSIGADAFNWLVEQSEGKFFGAAERANPKGYAENGAKAARDISKRVSHAGDYLEGFTLLRPAELSTARVKRMIEVGALRVYTKKYYPQLKRDWEFMGGIVAFTGANLAETLFNNKTHESRKAALEIQEDIYFKRFFAIREWQMSVLEKIEQNGYIQMPDSSFLRLYGSPEDRAKAGVAGMGQGQSARHVQAVMLRYKREGFDPILQVHDELVWERPKETTKDQHREFLQMMQEATWRLPDFAVPADSKVGPNWKDMEAL